jgi:hypothetical protein
MTDTICCGSCLLNQDFNDLDFSKPFTKFNKNGLTDNEKEILKNLGTAWNSFIKLDNLSVDDAQEMKDAIHSAQKLIALRVARRIDIEVWNQP